MRTFLSKSILHSLIFAAMLASLLGSAVFVTPAHASTFTVTKTADTDDGVCDGDCSLREAIATASPGDTITFAPALSGATIYLNSTLTLAQDVTIDGSALALQVTISGDSDNNGTGDVRVFFVNSSVTATLGSLVITKGVASDSGAGIYNQGTLTITNSTVSNNSAATTNGGGIFNDTGATLTITNSTLSGNSASSGNGAGISNQSGGTLTVANSTFSSNSAAVGGGISNLNGGTLTLTNSTLSGNSGSTTGGGIFNGGTLNYANTIIANSPTGGDCDTGSGSLGTNTSNLVEDGSCSAAISGDPNLSALANNGGPTQTMALQPGSIAILAGDDTVCAAAPVNNLDQRGTVRPTGVHCDIGAYEHSDTLAPTITAFNVPASPTSLNIPITTFTASDDGILTGYLITETSAQPLLSDAGWTASAPSTYPVASMGLYTLYPWAKDAAGHISAVYGTGVSVDITCLASITVTSSADSGAGTLRQAIADACGGGTIDFNSALSGNTIHLASTLVISKNLTIDGSALTSKITISGEHTVRVLQTTGHNLVTVALNGLIVTNGFVSSGDGGGLLNDSITTITNSVFDGNTAVNGGAITTDGALTVIDSTFSGNSSTDSSGQGGGGAILNNYTMLINGSTFSENSANATNGSGGAILHVALGQIYNSTFSGNSAAEGGAIATTTDLTITNSTISGNSAVTTGGLEIAGHTTNLVNTIIANNSASYGPSNDDCSNFATIGTNTHNLIGDGTCSPFLSGDPNLGPLANNGGPTQTLALLPGSMAISAGDDASCAASPVSNLDQRGFTRASNGPHCDIGAYEYQDSVAPAVISFSVSPSNTPTFPITAFTASDALALGGYKITESSTPPLAGASGWTASAPTTYTISGAGSHTLYPWAKDAAGNVSPVFGSPISVAVDTTAPHVVSINRAGSSPTGAASVNFLVTFSEAVKSVDSADFSLTTRNLSGGAITAVSGGPTVFTVSVGTGSGGGTIRLNVPKTATITDRGGNALTRLPFTSGQLYAITKTVTFLSLASQDGSLRESSETSGMGGSVYPGGTTFSLGDDGARRQYRAVLSFRTGPGLPDSAVVTGVTLSVEQSGVVGTGDPLVMFNGFMVDIMNGTFGTPALQSSDFQAQANHTYGPFTSGPVSNWYSLNLTGGKLYINKLAAGSALTQIRLRFKMDDNNDRLPNSLTLFSGNALTADRPQLVISYFVP